MSNEFDPNDEGNILVAELRIIEYIDPDGNLNTVDLSQGTNGAELEEQEYSHLIDWAQAFAIAPKVAAILAGDD